VKPLLAKSYDSKIYPNAPPEYALLASHSRDVATACGALARTLGLQCLRNAALADEMFEEFHRALLLNGWAQDTGKANSHFQGRLSGAVPKQLIRHEALSTIMFWTIPELRTWLSPVKESTFVAGMWGALGHHRKFHDGSKAEDVSDNMTVFLTHPDFRMILSELGQSLNLDSSPIFRENLVFAYRSRQASILAAPLVLHDLQDEFKTLEGLFESPEARRFLGLVKALGIAADVCASAIAYKQSQSADCCSIEEFVEDLGTVGLKVRHFSKIIQKRLENSRNLTTQDARKDFQLAVAQSPATLTLVSAGCGSGKSIAAYEWGSKWCQKATDEGRQNFRFFFCLPTTGTTTEHFKDYALESGIDESLMSLTHSKAKLDLLSMSETIYEEETDEMSNKLSPAEAYLRASKDKIDALALWSTPLVVTTVDTVLGLMVNARRSIYSFPAIMNAAIVFDECHAFDEQLFGHLLAFVTNFPHIPTLLMTASLPKNRLEALKKARSDLKIIPGPENFELAPRYRISQEHHGLVELFEKVQQCVAAGGKVLWIRNQVQWANQTYREVLNAFPSSVYVDVYHSRFKYEHRSIRHRRVIDEFKNNSTSCILIATQVAEMSLDLSADLLITDTASISALIQRLGRLNRESIPKNIVGSNAIILPPPNGNSLPYEQSEIEDAQTWIEALLNRTLNQRDLSSEFEEIRKGRSYDLKKSQKDALFFSGLWQTRPGLTRVAGNTMSVILEEDLVQWTTVNQFGQPNIEWIRNHEVAIPIKARMANWKGRIGYTPVAPSSDVAYCYDLTTHIGTGAEWKS
jgi:CRISPR-associated endonuclease/helicase Cas3